MFSVRRHLMFCSVRPCVFTVPIYLPCADHDSVPNIYQTWNYISQTQEYRLVINFFFILYCNLLLIVNLSSSGNLFFIVLYQWCWCVGTSENNPHPLQSVTSVFVSSSLSLRYYYSLITYYYVNPNYMWPSKF